MTFITTLTDIIAIVIAHTLPKLKAINFQLDKEMDIEEKVKMTHH